MNVTRISPRTGKPTTRDLPVTLEQLQEMALPMSRRRMIQDIFPDLDNDQREFIKTGYTAEDWAAMFPPEKE